MAPDGNVVLFCFLVNRTIKYENYVGPEGSQFPTKNMVLKPLFFIGKVYL